MSEDDEYSRSKYDSDTEYVDGITVEDTQFSTEQTDDSMEYGDNSCHNGNSFRGGNCGSTGYTGGSFKSRAAQLLSSDLVKALLVVLVIMLLFSLYHYSKNQMQMRRYGMPALRRRFPNFSSSRP
jgi:hypothetical protein